jgi:hypothetical protein
MDRNTATITDIYVFTDPVWANLDLSGYHVEGVDGEIGSVDETTYEIGADALVVDTGPWIFGKKVMLPVGVIDRIDPDSHKVFTTLTKDQIKNAPEFDESRFHDRVHREEIGSYYGRNRPAGPDYGKSDRGF